MGKEILKFGNIEIERKKFYSNRNTMMDKQKSFIKKYNTIWDKVSADIKNELDSEPV